MNNEHMYGLLEWPDHSKKTTEPAETVEVEESSEEQVTNERQYEVRRR